jgi:hypothetical protein
VTHVLTLKARRLAGARRHRKCDRVVWGNVLLLAVRRVASSCSSGSPTRSHRDAAEPVAARLNGDRLPEPVVSTDSLFRLYRAMYVAQSPRIYVEPIMCSSSTSCSITVEPRRRSRYNA